MKNIFLGMMLVAMMSTSVSAQIIKLSKANLRPAQASMENTKLDGKDALRVIMDPAVKLFDQPTFVKLKDLNFKDGTIEVRVLSKFLPGAPEWARGFIGLTFRIDDNNKNFEGIYIRPSNGRATDQVRRNHSIQYFSYPDHSFEELRKTSPEVYESYGDMEMNKWIKLKIVIKGAHAELFLDNNTQPSLIVNDLKHGANSTGSIGLWVGPGTDGYFADLSVKKN